MMLVNHHAVEAGLAAVLQLIEVHAVQLLGPFGAKMLVAKHQVVVAVLSGLILRICRIPHLSEEVNFLDHVGPPTPERLLTQPGLGQVCWRVPGASRRCQEIQNYLHKFCGLLHLRHLTPPVQALRSYTWNRTLIELTNVEGNDRVLASPDQQCWRGDP